jgi:hypothetical protein
MRTSKLSTLVATALTACGALPTAAQEPKPIRIAVNTAVQLQVGRDTVVGVKMAIDAINAKGGLLTRKLEVAVADAGEAVSGGAKMGIAAVNKLTAEDHVDVLVGGYDSGVTLDAVHDVMDSPGLEPALRPMARQRRASRDLAQSTRHRRDDQCAVDATELTGARGCCHRSWA